MQLNTDFDKRVVVHAARIPWQPSPIPGVERRMLDRIGGEIARATSLVRYAVGSRFSPHVHGGGEEFFVLEGVFQDEHGDFPTGTYVRNPPTSSHTPGSAPGCVIFVKLWQFDLDDRRHVRIDTNQASFVPGERPGVEILPLFKDAKEDVRLERWKAGASIEHDAPNGLELLVLRGTLVEQADHLTEYSWLRLPRGGRLAATAGEDGALVWIKSGHLGQEIRAPEPAFV